MSLPSPTMSTPNADAWELAGFPGRLDIAAYLQETTSINRTIRTRYGPPDLPVRRPVSHQDHWRIHRSAP